MDWFSYYISAHDGQTVTLTLTSTSTRQAGKPDSVLLTFPSVSSKQQFMNSWGGATNSTGSSGTVDLRVS